MRKSLFTEGFLYRWARKMCMFMINYIALDKLLGKLGRDFLIPNETWKSVQLYVHVYLTGGRILFSLF